MKWCPRSEDDVEWIEEHSPPEWMLALLELNPSYVNWAPGDDYMNGKWWSAPEWIETWANFRGYVLDDINECVNFYFELLEDGGRS